MAIRSWREKLENWGLVTVITVLVWLYAEGENVQTYNNELVQIRFTAPPGEQMAVTPSDPTNVLVSFRGSSGQMQQFQQLAQRPIRLPVAPLGEDNTADHRVVVLRDQLADSALGDIGINILETDPATIDVQIEPLTTVKLPVSVDAGAVQLAPSPTIKPHEVEVTLPARLAELVQGAKLTARLDQAVNLSTLDVSANYDINVPLTLPPLLRDEKHVTLRRDTVEVSFTIRKVTDTYEPPFLPIRINAQPRILNTYKVELPDDQLVVRGVKLSGPSDVIRRIKSGQTDVWAEVRLSSEDVESGVTTVALFINVPAGVTVTSPQPRVQVKVTPR